MNSYTVSFFGHRQIEFFSKAELRLESEIRKLLNSQECIEFLVGRSGEFDQMAASAVHRLRRAVREDNSALTLVLPYMTAEAEDNAASFESYYDSVEVSAAASGAHFKAAISRRNREMIDRSDLVICCIERQSGGAYQAVKYAERQGKKIINVASDD